MEVLPMLKESSTSLRNAYDSISKLAHETQMPVYITKNGENDLVLMSIKAFEKREALIDLKEKLLLAEEQRIGGEKISSLDAVYKRIKGRIEKQL